MFQKIGNWTEKSEEKCFNIEDLKNACIDGQREANLSKVRRTGSEMTIFRAYTYTIKKPSREVNILDFVGMHSSGAVTYRKRPNTTMNHVVPKIILRRIGLLIPESCRKKIQRKKKDLVLRATTEDAVKIKYDYITMQREQARSENWLTKIENMSF